mgnify:FL=1|tara:strand:+ start:382 stop:582 length:201 start_codon:yes stop_codon:yes gene_type:complete
MNTLKLPGGTKFETTKEIWRVGVIFKPGTVGTITENLLAFNVGYPRYAAEIDGRRVIVFCNEIKER